MRICILTHTFPRFPGDKISSIFMAELAQSMVDAGNDVWVLTPYTPLFKKTKTDYKIVTYKYIFPDSLHKLGYSETLANDMQLPIVMWILSPFMYLFGFIALLKLVKDKQIEVVNAHWVLPNGFIASVVSLFTGVTVVSTLPGSDVYMAQKNVLFNILARFATWKSKWITSNSYQLIKDLAKTTHMDLSYKSSNIVYGPGSSKFKPDALIGKKTKSELGFKAGDLIVFGVGRLVAKKGFKYLIKAAPQIIKKHKNTFFVIAGDGEQRTYLEKLAEKLKVADHFKFLGNVSYSVMNGYYNMADVFILPSVRDEKGNLDDQSVAVMDAMVCGKPTITTNFPGYSSVINNGVTGILIDEGNSNQIAKEIVSLLASPIKRKTLGMNAHKSIQDNFSWKRIGQQYTSLFTTLQSNPYSIGVPKIMNEEGRERIAKQIWSVLSHNLRNSGKLTCLDVGSSNGIIANYLADKFKSVTAVDVDEPAIDYAKKHFQKANLEFKVMDIQKLNFKDNSFDVVVCNQVYNFVNSPEKLMAEIYRVLKPDGICFFGARNKYALIEPQYNLPFASWLPGLLPFGKKYMSYWQLKSLVEKFELRDYTVTIIKQPKEYGYTTLEKYKSISKFLPLKLFEFLIPNYIWILEK